MPFMRLILICCIFILMPLVSTHAEPLKIGRGGDGIQVSTAQIRWSSDDEPRKYQSDICAGDQLEHNPHHSPTACLDAAYVSVRLLKEYASRLQLAEKKINEMEALHNSRIEKLLKDFDILSDNLDALTKSADEK